MMKLTILGSSSKGNGYILETSDSALLIECGCHYRDAMVALNWKRRKIAGCLVSHQHGDHAGYLKEYLHHYIHCYVSKPLMAEHTCLHDNNLYQRMTNIGGGFSYQALPMKHTGSKGEDCECWGFVIYHKEMGATLFVTDTSYIPEDLSDVPFQHVMIAPNYDEEIIRHNVEMERITTTQMKHVVQGHMSLTQCVKELSNLDLHDCRDIILMHLSPQNSNPEIAQKTIEDKFQITTHVAVPGTSIEYNKDPF